MARHEMKQFIKAGVPEEDRVILKIAKQTESNLEIFEWEHSREFRYKGEMYDVLSREEHGDTTYYSCIHDVKESGLFKELDDLVTRFMNEEDDSQQEFFSGFFEKVYLRYSPPKPFHAEVKEQFNTAYLEISTQEALSKIYHPPSV